MQVQEAVIRIMVSPLSSLIKEFNKSRLLWIKEKEKRENKFKYFNGLIDAYSSCILATMAKALKLKNSVENTTFLLEVLQEISKISSSSDISKN